MTEPGPRYYVEGGLVSGFAAWRLGRSIPRYLRDALDDLPPHLRTEVEDAVEAMRYSGQRWAATARGSAAEPPAEAPVCSKQEADELSSVEVADVLKVTERRVRQLAAAGVLPGRQKAGRWSFDRGAVTAYHEERKQKWH